MGDFWGGCVRFTWCVEIAKCLYSRVSLVSVPIHPSFIFHLFPFCLSSVKFDIICFWKYCAFFVEFEKVSGSQPKCSKAKDEVGDEDVRELTTLVFVLRREKGFKILSLLSVIYFFLCGYILLNLPLCLDSNKCSSIPYTPFFSIWLSSHMYIQPKVCVSSQFFFHSSSMRFLATSFFGAHLFRCVALVYFFLKKINFSYNFLKIVLWIDKPISVLSMSHAPRNFPSFFCGPF